MYKNIRFSKIDIPNFPDDIIRVAQDSSGFMWFAAYSYGVMRYDGSNFKQYIHEYDDTNSLGSDYVNEIFVDSRGIIWLGSRNSIMVYNPEQDHFKIVFQGNQFRDQVGNIQQIKEAPDNRLVIQCYKGLIIVKVDARNIRNSQFELYPLTEDSSFPASIQSVCIDNKNTIFASTNNGFLRKRLTDTSFSVFDGISVGNQHIRYRAFDDHCNCFVTNNNGIQIYKYDSLAFEYIQTLTHYTWTQGREILPVSTPYIDHNGVYWMHTRFGIDVLILSDNLKKVEAYYHYESLKESNHTIQGNIIRDICFDNSNCIWISTTNGISYFAPSATSFQFFTPDAFNGEANITIRNFTQNHNEFIWMASNGKGLFLLNLRANKLLKIPTEIVPNFSVMDGLTSSDKTNLWIASGDIKQPGVYKLTIEEDFYTSADFKKLSLQKLKLTDIGFHSDIDKPVTYINFDTLNNLWLGTDNFGLLRIQVNDDGSPIKVLNQYQSTTNDKRYQIANTSIHDMLRLKNGNYVFATRSKGIFVIDTNYIIDTLRTKAGLNISQNLIKINMIFQDNSENIYISTANLGLVKFDKDFTQTKFYTTKNGLSSNTIFSVLQNNKGQIWVNTNRGICTLNNDNETFNKINTSYDGSERSFFGPYFKDKEGSFYYAFENFGIIKIHFIDSVNTKKSKHDIVFTQLHINNKLIQVNDTTNHILSKALNYTNLIRLKHYQNNVTIGFASLTYPSSENCYYRYKLKGIDDDWIQTSHPVNHANYSKLPGGKYTFVLYGTNRNGEWSQIPRELNIHIDLVFYRTLWFNVLISIVFLISLIAYYFVRVRSIKTRTQQLESLVGERTIEIETKNTILIHQANELLETNTLLEERQQQIEKQSEELLSQKNKLEISVNTKNTLFSIIAHDIKNPFNTLLGFAELLKKKGHTLPKQKTDNYIDIIYSSSRNIYQLLENLLQWSRSQLGTIKVNYQHIALKSITGDIGEVLAEQIASKKNKFICKFDPTLTLRTDYILLNTVLRNLINNSAKYTQNGIITIESYRENSCVIIKIIDNGIGIKKEIQDELFLITKGKTQAGTSGEIGTGLGLIVCKDFVELLNGSIAVESNENQGTTFIITLPQNNIEADINKHNN